MTHGASFSRTRHRTLVTLGLVSALALLQGCTAMSRPRAMPDDPAFAPVLPQAMMPRDPNSGAIFQSARNYDFYGDTTALNVGDVLTVTLQESTRASKSQDTDIKKNNKVTLPNPTILGRTKLGLTTDLDNKRYFKGQAGADQSNSLNGSITVTVTEVLPNGVLRIRGEKWLSLTNGDEYIRLTGLVRPQDIQPDNTVASNRIADARIGYGGTGDLDQANRMGWAARFFNSEWWPL